jgi:hypothetical protein
MPEWLPILKTARPVDVPAKVVPKFKPSASLKEIFEDYDLGEDGADEEVADGEPAE